MATQKKMQETKAPLMRDQLVTVFDLECLKNELLVAIKRMLTEHAPKKSKQWVKSYEVKRLFDISTGTLQHLRTNGELPYYKLGGIIYFDMADIDNVMEKRKIPPRGGIPSFSNRKTIQ